MKRRVFILLCLSMIHCASAASPENAVRRYLRAQTREQALAALAPEYTLRFGAANSEGMSRDEVAKSLMWDFALRPSHDILSLRRDGDVIVAVVHEENDFSRLLGFPGWTATSTFVVDQTGRIVSQLYVPRAGQPDWRTYLDEPLQWIRTHSPESLDRIYSGGKLVRSPESAAEWVRLLTAWRAALRPGSVSIRPGVSAPA